MLMLAETLSSVQGEECGGGGGGAKVRRVLLVEDQFMVARALSQLLEDFGVRVVGPARSVAKALALLSSERCDAAVLDINLGDETVEPVAQKLTELGLPFMFVSGYASPKLLNPEFHSRTLLHKPVDPEVFRQTLAAVLGDG